jgi:lipoprotein-anchoring transpeptidase ErfK/SrfK
MVFEDRQPVCLYAQHPEAGKKGLITSRILWLAGLEPGYNQGQWATPDAHHGQCCDSYERYIYIHGTGLEEKIGTPFSQGCINMRNRDIICLFDAVHEDATEVHLIP